MLAVILFTFWTGEKVDVRQSNFQFLQAPLKLDKCGVICGREKASFVRARELRNNEQAKFWVALRSRFSAKWLSHFWGYGDVICFSDTPEGARKEMIGLPGVSSLASVRSEIRAASLFAIPRHCIFDSELWDRVFCILDLDGYFFHARWKTWAHIARLGRKGRLVLSMD